MLSKPDRLTRFLAPSLPPPLETGLGPGLRCHHGRFHPQGL